MFELLVFTTLPRVNKTRTNASQFVSNNASLPSRGTGETSSSFGTKRAQTRALKELISGMNYALAYSGD
jgi:hypothetical protein